MYIVSVREAMAACGSLQHIFENPLPENHSLSSWNQIKPPAVKPIEKSSVSEIFGELHFKDNSNSPSASSSFTISPPTLSSKSMIDLNSENSASLIKTSPKIDETFQSNESKAGSFCGSQKIIKYKNSCRSMSCDSFSLNSASLQLCTEGLGFESSDDVEEMENEIKEDHWKRKEGYSNRTMRRSRASSVGTFPPPISCIGKSGRPWVCFKSYRQDGRFVLKEVRVPTLEFLHACREDGRFKLQFVQPNEEKEEEEEEEDLDEVEDLEGGIINDESEEIRKTL